MEKISIIIPVYNTADYLDTCMQSVVSQTYINLEIIVIDDASTDSSSSILDHWTHKDPRIQVIHKQCHSGVSASRNIGLQHATGEFIAFVDSDDWLSPDTICSLHKWISKTSADIVFGGYNRVRKNDIVSIVPAPSSGTIVNHEEALMHCIPQRGVGRYDLFIWNKLFRRKVLLDKEKLIQFDPSFNYCEDVLWLIQIILNSQKIVFWHGAGYNYISMRPGNTWSQLSTYTNLSYCESAYKVNCIVYQKLSEADSKSANNALQRKLFSQKYAFRTAKLLNNREAYFKYFSGYITDLFKWYSGNRTFTGLKWLVRQLISHILFTLKSSLRVKKKG